jgi:hypothetical protein
MLQMTGFSTGTPDAIDERTRARPSMTHDDIARIDIGQPAASAGYLFNVGDFMLMFSTVSGTTALAVVVYGTSEFRPHSFLEAALQAVLTVAALGYVPLLAWRGYDRRYWRGHALLGSLLVLGILAGIPAVLLEGGPWTWSRTLAFAIFVAIFLFFAAIPLGFALTARELLQTRLTPDGPLLADVVAAFPHDVARPFAGRSRSGFAIIGLAMTSVGVAGILAAAALLAVYGLAEGRDPALAETTSDLFLAAIVGLPLCAAAIAFGKRLAQPSAARLLEADERAPILLLRSFADDARQVRSKGLSTRVLSLGVRGRKRLEAAVADELARLGPFVAIGQPGERLPRLGAARAYFSDDEWQRAVIDWIARARLIVMVAGRTAWLQWELKEIVRAGQLGKLLLLLPPGDAADRSQRLELIAVALDDRLLLTHVADASKAIAIRFRDHPGNSKPAGAAMIIDSVTTTEVDYELAIRVANYTD